MKKNVSMNEIVPLIEETIRNNKQFRLYIKGVSMIPLLREEKDSVLLGKCDEIEKNDIILYRRRNGQYVLHRVMKIEETLTLCGDNQHYFEYGIK